MLTFIRRQPETTLRTVPTRVAQLNTDQRFRYSLEELQQMLAAAVAAR